MKSVMLAAVAGLALATAASAADVSYLGYGEYAVEAQTFEVGVGAELGFGQLTITPTLIGSDVAGSFDFDHAEVRADFAVNANVTAYGKIATDDELRYDEATVGVAFKF